ncbi:MAG: hypothetical protein N4A68_17775 [Maledivibacter sp.]|jgi:hypothetical protein|nr:hypothetical protein [Maledivibacter sp.]
MNRIKIDHFGRILKIDDGFIQKSPSNFIQEIQAELSSNIIVEPKAYFINIKENGEIIIERIKNYDLIKFKNSNVELGKQLFKSQTELLKSETENSKLEQRLFQLETQLLSKGVIL